MMDRLGWFLLGTAVGGALLLLFLVAGWSLALLGGFCLATVIAWGAGRVQRRLGDPG
jgi:hypothetical protein